MSKITFAVGTDNQGQATSLGHSTTLGDELPRIPPSDCALLHLPRKPWGTLQTMPRNAINKLIEDGVAEELEGERFAFKPAVEATAAEQCLFAAMPPSWHRDKLIQRHYPEHFRLLSSNSAEKPAAGESLLASGRAGASKSTTDSHWRGCTTCDAERD